MHICRWKPKLSEGSFYLATWTTSLLLFTAVRPTSNFDEKYYFRIYFIGNSSVVWTLKINKYSTITTYWFLCPVTLSLTISRLCTLHTHTHAHPTLGSGFSFLHNKFKNKNPWKRISADTVLDIIFRILFVFLFCFFFFYSFSRKEITFHIVWLRMRDNQRPTIKNF